MKRLSSDGLERQKTLLRQQEKHLRKLRQKKRQKNPDKHKDTKPPRKKAPPNRKEFDFDHDIDIYQKDNREHMFDKCRRIRHFQGNHIHLSFPSDEMKISAAGMLLLYAEIYRKIEIENTKITCDYPANRKAEQVLQHIGFFKQIGKEERISDDEIRKASQDVHSWHVITGKAFNGEEVSDFLDKIVPFMSRDSDVYIAVKEIIDNAEEHAYEEDASFRPWIAFGRINEKSEISIVVGDLGMTIPYTINKQPWVKELQVKKLKFFPKKAIKILSDDSGLIYFATKYKESGTLKPYRGRGLRRAIENINKLRGIVSIYSRSGSYDSDISLKITRKNSGKESKFKKTQGTIVQMSIPLPSEKK